MPDLVLAIPKREALFVESYPEWPGIHSVWRWIVKAAELPSAIIWGMQRFCAIHDDGIIAHYALIVITPDDAGVQG